jgi:hypothetical protein
VRREQAIPGMNVIQNGCAEMQASGPAVLGWLSDLPGGALGDIKHAEAKSPFVAALSGTHLSSIEKRDFSLRRAINPSSIFELFDSGIDQTDRELVVPMRCERMIEVAGMKNLNASGNVVGRAPGLFLHAFSMRDPFSQSFDARNHCKTPSSYKTSLPAGTCQCQVRLPNWNSPINLRFEDCVIEDQQASLQHRSTPSKNSSRFCGTNRGR